MIRLILRGSVIHRCYLFVPYQTYLKSVSIQDHLRSFLTPPWVFQPRNLAYTNPQCYEFSLPRNFWYHWLQFGFPSKCPSDQRSIIPQIHLRFDLFCSQSESLKVSFSQLYTSRSAADRSQLYFIKKRYVCWFQSLDDVHSPYSASLSTCNKFCLF